MSNFVFKVDRAIPNLKETPLKEGITIKIWKPSLTNLIPPLHGRQYFLRWLAHYLGFFKNKEYSAIIAYDNKIPIGAMVIIPTNKRWKFMKKEDVHFTSLVLHKDYRGAGIAYHIMKFGVENYSSNHREIWTIVKNDNFPALKLVEKVGFIYFSKAMRVKKFGLKSLGEVLLLPKK